MKRPPSLAGKIVVGVAGAATVLVLSFFLLPFVWLGVAVRLPGDSYVHASNLIQYACTVCPPYDRYYDLQDRWLHPPKFQPRLTKAQAVQIANGIPFPADCTPLQYVYHGNAYFLDQFGLWAVHYDYTLPGSVVIEQFGFVIVIDDTNGKFVRYNFSR